MTALAALAVTGSTGALGGAVASALAERGMPQRLLVRSPDRAPRLPGASVHRAAFGDRDDCLAALEGVETLFMVSASESADRLAQHLALVDAAADAGVRHVVYTSFVGAGPDAVFTLARDHGATEERIRSSGMAWTFLRDSFYLDVLELFAGEDDALRGPAGQGRCAFVARSDVAAAATAVLLDPAAHAGATYELTGPQALSLADAAATLSAVRARPFRFVDETLAEAYASRAGYGAPDWQVDAWVSTYTAIAAGGMAVVSGDVERLTGRAPRSFEQLLRG